MARRIPAQEKSPLLSALSLAGALLIVGGGLVGLGRLMTPAPVAPRPDVRAAAPRTTPSPQAGPALTPQAKPDARRIERPLATTGPAPDGIYKCREHGRTVYADHPCSAQAEALTVAPASAGLSPDRSYAEQLAQLQAERARHAARQPAPDPAAAPAGTHDARCAAIDETVRRIDAATRQPLGIPELEHFRAQRKALMDERFSIPCNG